MKGADGICPREKRQPGGRVRWHSSTLSLVTWRALNVLGTMSHVSCVVGVCVCVWGRGGGDQTADLVLPSGTKVHAGPGQEGGLKLKFGLQPFRIPHIIQPDSVKEEGVRKDGGGGGTGWSNSCPRPAVWHGCGYRQLSGIPRILQWENCGEGGRRGGVGGGGWFSSGTFCKVAKA